MLSGYPKSMRPGRCLFSRIERWAELFGQAIYATSARATALTDIQTVRGRRSFEGTQRHRRADEALDSQSRLARFENRCNRSDRGNYVLLNPLHLLLLVLNLSLPLAPYVAPILSRPRHFCHKLGGGSGG